MAGTGRWIHLHTVDSTNEYLKRNGEELPDWTLVTASHQTAGKGRQGKVWQDCEAQSFLGSWLLKGLSEEQLKLLPMAAGLAVSQALEQQGMKPVWLKWPNDVVISRKKICGILTEMGTNGVKINYVLIGVGINVNLKEFPEEMQDKATSLILESGQEYDRNQVISQVMKYFEINYEKFVQTCDFTHLLEDYHKILANLNQPVRVLDGSKSFEGICRGIDEKGELLVEKQDKEITKVSAGEVSVRGLYSYV